MNRFNIYRVKQAYDLRSRLFTSTGWGVQEVPVVRETAPFWVRSNGADPGDPSYWEWRSEKDNDEFGTLAEAQAECRRRKVERRRELLPELKVINWKLARTEVA
jgi:hypothetical protein